MCMSPHEMSSARLEEDLKNWQEFADRMRVEGNENTARYGDEKAKKILKERAEDGSYDSDTDPVTGDKRY